jgi:hypothetical protein
MHQLAAANSLNSIKQEKQQTRLLPRFLARQGEAEPNAPQSSIPYADHECTQEEITDRDMD